MDVGRTTGKLTKQQQILTGFPRGPVGHITTSETHEDQMETSTIVIFMDLGEISEEEVPDQ